MGKPGDLRLSLRTHVKRKTKLFSVFPFPSVIWKFCFLLSLKFSLIVKHFSETHSTFVYESLSLSLPMAFDGLLIV